MQLGSEVLTTSSRGSPYDGLASEKRGLSYEGTRGGDRLYDLSLLGGVPRGSKTTDRQTVAYAWVSSHDQKDDLERQRQVLELYCAQIVPTGSVGW